MAPEKIVLDASVVVKWFSEEENTGKALEIRDRYSRDQIDIAVPGLLLYEISNALRYNPGLSSEDVKKANQSLRDMELFILSPSQEVFDLATETSFEQEITIYDSIYIALAQLLGIKLITADTELAEKADNTVHLENFVQ